MFRSLLVVGTLVLGTVASAKEPIRLPNNPSLSPDGKLLAFDWAGDIWLASADGGLARPLTTNPARDTSPKFSPDGTEIAFVSDREGSSQIFVVPVAGGTPKQMTFHTAGYGLHEWTADGQGWLVRTQRDHGWTNRNNERIQIVQRPTDGGKRAADQLLFDDYGTEGTLSANGQSVLFTREGPVWWRKGYYGSQVAQIWQFDRTQQTFTPIVKGKYDARWPLFGKNNKMYYADGTKNCFNIWEHDLKQPDKPNRQVTKFLDDSTVFPAISRDGSTLVFRVLFDLYRVKPGVDETPVKLELFRDDDRSSERIDRRVLTTATAAAFTSDGLEVAFIAGGDVWVMDTELREPKRVTKTAEEERNVMFAPDGQSLVFVSDAGGKPEIWRATKDGKRPWFLTDAFKLEALTNDGFDKERLSFSPDGSKFAYVKGRGELIVADADGKNPKTVIDSWNTPQYDWSPDGKWLVYSLFDNDFNSDIYIQPLDGSRPAFNLSRHPFNEANPVWSPDGKMIAFVGARGEKDKTDIHFVYLSAADDEKSTREKTLEKALEKFMKGKSFPMKKTEGDTEQDPGPMPRVKDDKGNPMPMPPVGTKKDPTPVTIDFNGIRDRIRRITIPNSNEGSLLWSPDSKKLAFGATVDGQAGYFSVDIPDNLRPTQISSNTGSGAKWLRNGTIVWLSGGRPASFTPGTGVTTTPATTPTTGTGGGRGPGFGPRPGGGLGGGATPVAGGYSFTVYQDIDKAKKHQAAFDMCWRTMRDNWYDHRLGNRDWNRVREKYRAMAETPDLDTLTTVVQLMLGELNGSHLGFTTGALGRLPARPGAPTTEEPSADRNWRNVTVHPGVRFDLSFKGPGLKIRDVLPDGPADQKKSQLLPGEIVLSVNGTKVDATTDLTPVFTLPPGSELKLTVQDAAGKERPVTIRPTTFEATRTMLYKAWLRDNAAKVEQLSKGTLGYLHISAMDQPSFIKFQEELYNAGAGKDGLVIDVRENGGGSTADLLLTALTQPQHAIAVPRGGGQGYPQDRTIFATWNKPIIVLCNQNSFSNAEIFSHAVKTLKRGRVVGVPTAGGVISTGAASIMDVGTLRLPFRGWYLVNDGEDMELHGAEPHIIVWPQPGDAAKGKDAQIEAGVKALLEDVQAWKNRPQPKLQKATERK